MLGLNMDVGVDEDVNVDKVLDVGVDLESVNRLMRV